MHRDALALKLASRDKRLSWAVRFFAKVISTLALSMVNPLGDGFVQAAIVYPLVDFAKRRVPHEIWSEHYTAASNIKAISGDEFFAVSMASVVVAVLMLTGYLLYRVAT